MISTSTSNLIPAVIAFQASWARCGNCQGLFYGPHQSTSWCPTGYAHSAADNTDYYLGYDINVPNGPPW